MGESVPDVNGHDLTPPWIYVESGDLNRDHYHPNITASAAVCARCGALIAQARGPLDQHDRFHRLLAYIDRDSRLGGF
jgi:hypothetical protein